MFVLNNANQWNELPDNLKNPANDDDNPQLESGNDGAGNDNGAENSHPVVNGNDGAANGAENSNGVAKFSPQVIFFELV
ncbi:hypothetical protein BpHYR1_004573 [Brachionus plicatilis]|uniref:Uncharacterized protein n=1 Tax=Brachionus plicatilis TaxID=10195 RepID=A0A3M7PSA3_BRAPC|nr:hypothetical protein BpHYR1_004573 [Brachionus plicatilis]